jgi:putative hemolysin
VVWLLDRSSALIFRLLRLDRESAAQVTAEELHLVVAEAHTAGVIDEDERAIISSVVRLAERPVRSVMTPRGEVDWIDASADAATILARLAETPHTRLPVGRGDLVALARSAPVVPDVTDAMDALTALQGAEVPMALVHDEYGHFEGIVTPADLLTAIAGVFASDIDDEDDPPAVEREDGSWLLAGSLSADGMADYLSLTLPVDRDYETTAGFVLSCLRRLPETGEHFDYKGWRFEIVDMDGRKIDKLLASPLR